jgi:hypothetical protein
LLKSTAATLKSPAAALKSAAVAARRPKLEPNSSQNVMNHLRC